MKKVVLIDDNWVIRGILAEKLEDHGFKVYLAEDGIEGMGLVYISEPEVIIIDQLIPRFDGFQLVKAIRTNKKYNKIKIFMMVDDFKDAPLKKMESLGVDEVFEKKNFDVEYVITKIQESTNSNQ